jgi:hypothetical protein
MMTGKQLGEQSERNEIAFQNVLDLAQQFLVAAFPHAKAEAISFVQTLKSYQAGNHARSMESFNSGAWDPSIPIGELVPLGTANEKDKARELAPEAKQ